MADTQRWVWWWYNPPHCLATWPLGNNSQLHSKAKQRSHPRETLPLQSSIHMREAALKKKERKKNSEGQRTITHAHAEIYYFELISLPPQMGQGWASLYMSAQTWRGEMGMKKMERQVHKKRRFDPAPVYHSHAEIKLAQAKDNTDITSDNKTRSASSRF